MGYKIFNKYQTLKRNRIINRLINNKDIVLEVGCGASPMKHSNVLLDKYVDITNLHRSNLKSINSINGKPFILGDGGNLPFKDKSVDTIICRHVVEHVDDPVSFIKELQRVGKKGYLEWPSIFCELIRGGYGHQDRIRELFPNDIKKHLLELEHGKGTIGHKWFIVPIGTTLYFVAKNKDIYPLYLVYGSYAKSKINKNILKKLLHIKESYCTWSYNNNINGIVISDGESNDISELLNENYDVKEQIKYLKNVNTKNHAYIMNSNRVKYALCCPVCKSGELKSIYDVALKCSICNREYPLVNGTPVLIDEAAN